MVVTLHKYSGFRAKLVFVLALLLAKPLLILFPVHDLGLRLLQRLNRLAERMSDAPGVDRTRTSLARRPTDLIVAAGQSRTDSDTAILYLHGGAFLAGGPGTHRNFAGLLARRLQIPVYVLDYRQLPETGVGASVQDSTLAYRELLDSYARVVLMGDSAGGYLCGKVVEHVHAEGLPKPVAYVGYSPFLDLELASKPHSTSRHDAYLPKGKLRKLAPNFYRGPVAFPGEKGVAALPGEAFPPTLLITAQGEFLEPDAIALAEKIAATGTRAEVHSFPWQLHAFPVMAFSADAAESLDISTDFVRDALSATSGTGQSSAEEAV